MVNDPKLQEVMVATSVGIRDFLGTIRGTHLFGARASLTEVSANKLELRYVDNFDGERKTITIEVKI